MTITYNRRYPASTDEVKGAFQSLIGKDVLIFHRKTGQTYEKPSRTTVQDTYSEFVVCKDNSNKHESFNYTDFYCGNLIYDKVEI